MIKRKGAGVMMAIILVPICSWVAIVGLVIKPVFWFGAVLCLFGGVAIGCLIVLLMTTKAPEEEQAHKKPKYELGTRLVKPSGTHRYACAGEDLKKGTIVEADLAGRIAMPPLPAQIEHAPELIWGNVKAAKEIDPKGMYVLGWTEINVKKGWYCWLREPPPGSEFKKET